MIFIILKNALLLRISGLNLVFPTRGNFIF